MPTFSDVYTQVGNLECDVLITEVAAIFNSLKNIYSCPRGTRGFEPEYGSHFWHYLFEPCDFITAMKIDDTIITSTERWEPRVVLMSRQGLVTPLPTGDGYDVRVPIYIPALGRQEVYQMKAKK